MTNEGKKEMEDRRNVHTSTCKSTTEEMFVI